MLCAERLSEAAIFRVGKRSSVKSEEQAEAR